MAGRNGFARAFFVCGLANKLERAEAAPFRRGFRFQTELILLELAEAAPATVSSAAPNRNRIRSPEQRADSIHRRVVVGIIRRRDNRNTEAVEADKHRCRGD